MSGAWRSQAASGRWKTLTHAVGQAIESGIFSESATGVPIPANATSLMLDMCSGGGGGAGGGSHANNAGGGGGGNSGMFYLGVLVQVPPGSTTMDISIGAGGTGAAAGLATSTSGGNTSLIFKNAAGTTLNSLFAAGSGQSFAQPGLTAIAGVAANGGNGAGSPFYLASGGTGGSAGGGSPTFFNVQRGWGGLVACGGCAGGGVSTANVGSNGGVSTLALATMSLVWFPVVIPLGAGTYGGGGVGGPSLFTRGDKHGGIGGSAVAALPGGAGIAPATTSFGAGGGGGAGGTTGGAGGNGANGAIIIRYQK